MTNLSKDLRQLLKDNFVMTTLTTVVKQESKDGTIKFLFELQDGYTIETVLMRHDYGNSVCNDSSRLSNWLYILCFNFRWFKA